MSVGGLDRSQYALVIVCDAMVSPLLSDVTRTALIPKGLVKYWEGGNSAQVPLLSDSLLGKLARLVVFGGEANERRLRGVVFRPSKVKADPLAEQAIQAWQRPGVIQAAKQANPATQAKMLRMLDMRRRIGQNEALAARMRPTDITGESLMGRVNYLQNV